MDGDVLKSTWYLDFTECFKKCYCLKFPGKEVLTQPLKFVIKNVSCQLKNIPGGARLSKFRRLAKVVSKGSGAPCIARKNALGRTCRGVCPQATLAPPGAVHSPLGPASLPACGAHTAQAPSPYPGAGRRSPARTRRCGGSSRSPRSSGSRRCRRSAAGPSGCRAPPPPGPCLRERDRGEAAGGGAHTPSRQPLSGPGPRPPSPGPGWLRTYPSLRARGVRNSPGPSHT